MYQVFCDDELIYNPSIDALKIKSPKVNLEVNKAGSFEFQIYPNHPFYEDLKKLKSIIKVYQDGHLLFRGRIIDDSVRFHNEKQVTCEGEFAFLLDSIQRPYSYTGDIPAFFAQLLATHNSQVDASHQFKVGNITVVDPNGYVNRSDTTYQNTFNALTTKLIDTHGGYLWVRHEADGNYLDYLSDFTALSNQPVEFGKNLLDLSRRVKGADIATAIIPLGAKLEGSENRVTIANVNGGVDYVYSQDAVNLYGWIFRTQSWDDVTEPANLLTKANAYLASTINLSTEIELSAVDLSALNTNFSSFHLGTYVPVKTPSHGIDQNFLVNKLSIDLANPQSNKLTLGTTFSSFTEQNISASKNTQTFVSNLGASQTETKSAIVNLTEHTTTTAEHLQGDVANLKTVTTKHDTNFALAFDTSKTTYKTGMYCIYSNTLYKFTADKPSTGWDASKVTTGSLADAITDLQSKTTPGNWVAPTLQNNWVNYGEDFAPAGYFKDSDGVVHLRGLIKNRATTGETVLLTLPVGYRPAYRELFAVCTASGVGRIDAYPDGSVMTSTGVSASYTSLSGISFRAEN